MKRQRGFLLVEILLGLLILAIVLAAVISAVAQQANNAGAVKQKTLALWVAHNRLTEFQLQSEWPDFGNSSGEAKMSGLEWRWEAQVSKTEDENLRRVAIRIIDPEDAERAIAELDGFLAQN